MLNRKRVRYQSSKEVNSIRELLSRKSKRIVKTEEPYLELRNSEIDKRAMRTLKKRGRNQGIGDKLGKSDDQRAMPVEKSAQELRVRSAMAEEKP
ncbi:hypothetical protein E2542_SST00752 [Spatholobus suberectus]|nr:hypothetical protein E2542_SST00752 [Spatholobus suberectus]